MTLRFSPHKTWFNRLLLLAAAVVSWAPAARAQVSNEVVVGVTPKCPYANAPETCFYGAFDALGHLDGVESVDTTPDAYNCTATVYLKTGGLADIVKWAEQFRSKVHKNYVFRGVEVTVTGNVEEKDGKVVLTVPGLESPLILKQLQNKLQWNYRKRAARQPEPDEKAAYRQLGAALKDAGANPLQVEVKGPILGAGNDMTLEVREWYAKPIASDE